MFLIGGYAACRSGQPTEIGTDRPSMAAVKKSTHFEKGGEKESHTEAQLDEQRDDWLPVFKPMTESNRGHRARIMVGWLGVGVLHPDNI